MLVRSMASLICCDSPMRSWDDWAAFIWLEGSFRRAIGATICSKNEASRSAHWRYMRRWRGSSPESSPRRLDRRDGPARVGLGETLADDPQRQELLLLQRQDVSEPGDVGVVELAVTGPRPLGVDQALGFEEPDLRDAHVGKIDLDGLQ